jgi:hypothetical protein
MEAAVKWEVEIQNYHTNEDLINMLMRAEIKMLREMYPNLYPPEEDEESN